jgi:AraC-like DNA-binding protein
VSSPAATALLTHLDAALGSSALLSNANFSLAEAARVAAATPEAVAIALAGERGLTFKEYLTRVRIDEAKRLLVNPAEARTSMEAIGLLAGFGSRSAFYKAFHDQTGVSPAAFRAKTCPKS